MSEHRKSCYVGTDLICSGLHQWDEAQKKQELLGAPEWRIIIYGLELIKKRYDIDDDFKKRAMDLKAKIQRFPKL